MAGCLGGACSISHGRVNDITSHWGASGAACLDPRVASAPGVSQVHLGRLPIWLGPPVRACVCVCRVRVSVSVRAIQ